MTARNLSVPFDTCDSPPMAIRVTKGQLIDHQHKYKVCEGVDRARITRLPKQVSCNYRPH
jgi:hypothetical protein